MSSDTQTWSSNGKLLITGEYLVMEGALAMALPLKVGQTLSVRKNHNNILKWQANMPGGSWFTAEFDLNSFGVIITDNNILAKKLGDILVATRELSHTFLSDNVGFDVVTNLDFNPEYGFGTSSTLISNIAMWADVDPYKLLEKTFGGSGYDIACARTETPILYKKKDGVVEVRSVDFSPVFKDKLFFVYLGKKQNSADGIKAFKKNGKFTISDIVSISDITNQLVKTKDFTIFQELLEEHELILSKILDLPTAKSLLFDDFTGAVKSLGAWGGDFVLMTYNDSEQILRSYLEDKGFDIIFRYDELIL